MVKIEVGPSNIHGLGCFAGDRVEKGQLVWKFESGFDIALPKSQVDSLPVSARENLLTYAYVSKITGDYILCSDDSKFTNHSNDPNVRCFIPEGAEGNELVCFAVRDIEIGEEITNDYRDFDVDPYDVKFVFNE